MVRSLTLSTTAAARAVNASPGRSAGEVSARPALSVVSTARESTMMEGSPSRGVNARKVVKPWNPARCQIKMMRVLSQERSSTLKKSMGFRRKLRDRTSWLDLRRLRPRSISCWSRIQVPMTLS